MHCIEEHRSAGDRRTMKNTKEGRHFAKPTGRQVKHFLRTGLMVLAGNALAAAATAFFIIPNGLTLGGTTGLGIFFRKFWSNEFAVSIVVYIANIILFLIGAILLGKRFAVATLAGTLLYPSFMSLFTALNNYFVQRNGAPIAHDNLLLAALCGALLFGFGLGIVVRVGASTGGTDIPPLIFNKYFGIPISVSLWCLDMSIVLMQAFVNEIEIILYAVIITLLAAVVIDRVSVIGKKRVQVKIVSRHLRELRHLILDELNRGVTMLYGETGYLKEKCCVLLTVVSTRELVKLKNAVQSIDPEAFLMVSVISEVRGRGFTSEGIRLPKEAEAKDDLDELPQGSSVSAATISEELQKERKD